MKDIADAEIDEKTRSVITIKSEKRLLDETNCTPAQISSWELRMGDIVNKKGTRTGLRFANEINIYDQIDKYLVIN